ncbi:Hpt domain-containing protein [Pseudarthrobacter oxydans]|uniref:Hpt domain-containing protein n=1 Tax=Pseudarthrobacter oxydans TaxID=1671 RepID=UPI001571E6B7|nr:Hpt domain-containing protein [Pseudarthrobacter oxydans]NSX37182.1 Hpt domain-containing protein [Pseudarthrobacter oxydans]
MPEHPLIDSRATLDLADQMDSPHAALRFLSDYLVMLQGRLGRILVGLTGEDAETSMDAILSLKISSAMNGAHQAAASCHSLEALVHGGCFEMARAESVKLTAIVSRLTDSAAALLEQAMADLGLESLQDTFGASRAA